VTALLHDLTRPELDSLLADAEHAYVKAHIALTVAPLDNQLAIEGAAAVAGDCLALWDDALNESISRWWHGG
jgi:hypothetical protein